jgi:hypothetical protein
VEDAAAVARRVLAQAEARTAAARRKAEAKVGLYRLNPVDAP